MVTSAVVLRSLVLTNLPIILLSSVLIQEQGMEVSSHLFGTWCGTHWDMAWWRRASSNRASSHGCQGLLMFAWLCQASLHLHGKESRIEGQASGAGFYRHISQGSAILCYSAWWSWRVLCLWSPRILCTLPFSLNCGKNGSKHLWVSLLLAAEGTSQQLGWPGWPGGINASKVKNIRFTDPTSSVVVSSS